MTTLVPRTRAGVAAAALLLVAACGGGSDIPSAAEDEAAAQKVVLSSADLPGYTQEPLDPDESSSAIDRCVANNPLLSVEDNPRGVSGADFTKDDKNVQVQSGAMFAEKEADARKAFSDIQAALSSQCLKDEMRKTLEEAVDPGVVVRTVSAQTLPAPGGTDQSVASRVTVPLESEDERLTVYADLTFLRQGRGLAGVFTLQAGSPFPDAERTRLGEVVGDRLSEHVS
ncbi:MAG TPA: hypothetical protein VG078_04560 [Acidimicrobiales bacterium]|nr:hypothetical protein [Acidimicrobiales bacterium]